MVAMSVRLGACSWPLQFPCLLRTTFLQRLFSIVLASVQKGVVCVARVFLFSREGVLCLGCACTVLHDTTKN